MRWGASLWAEVACTDTGLSRRKSRGIPVEWSARAVTQFNELALPRLNTRNDRPQRHVPESVPADSTSARILQDAPHLNHILTVQFRGKVSF